MLLSFMMSISKEIIFSFFFRWVGGDIVDYMIVQSRKEHSKRKERSTFSKLLLASFHFISLLIYV